MAANPGNPKKPRPPTPYEHVKDQLDIKTRECETLQEINSSFGVSMSNARKEIENLRATISLMQAQRQNGQSRRIHVDSYIHALNERIAYLKRPWWSRSASYANQLRIASDMVLDRINRFDMDKDPGSPDAPGNIAGLEGRPPQQSTYVPEQQLYSVAQPDRHRPF